MKGFNYFKKIFLLVVATTVLSSGLLLSINLLRSGNEMQQAVENNLISNADQKEKLFNTYTSDLHNLTKSISDDWQIREYFLNLENGIDDIEFKNQLRLNLKQEIQSYDKVVESMFFAYKEKVFIDGLVPQAEGFVVSNQQWYGDTLERKESFIAEVSISPITNLPVMGSNYPIINDNGDVISIFVLTINLNGFSNMIIENTVDPNQSTMIVDRDGLIVASEDQTKIGSFSIASEIPKLYKKIKNNQEGIVYYEVNGEQYISCIKKSDYDIYIIQSMPISTYTSPMVFSFAISVIIMIIIVAGAIFMSYKIAKNITRPVKILVKEMEDMSNGHYEGEVPEKLNKRRDEFGKLGKALGIMKAETLTLINNLRDSNDELEASFEEIKEIEENLRKQNSLLIESENNLRESEEKNRAIIEALPDLVFILDYAGRFLDCQASNDNELAFPKESFIGKYIHEVLTPDIANLTYINIQKVVETGKLHQFEYMINVKGENLIYEMRIVKSSPEKVVAISRNITVQKRHQDRIEFLSFHDQLTGLYNRRYFEEELLRLDVPEKLPLCVLIADVNGLKLVNDSFGHKVGDELLIKTAEILKRSCQSNECVSRIGGDEFIILVPSMEEEKVEKLIERIKHNCETETVSSITISLSIGWEVKRSAEDEILEIFNKAEDHMYRRKLYESPSMRGKTITAIINTLYEKNKREEEHSRRVAEWSGKLAKACNLSEEQLDEIKTAGLLHDIGKIAVKETLLNKPGKLTPEEFEEVSRHSEIGFRILSAVNDMADIAEFALYHHERWDGKGYPKGIAGEEIILQARIIAIADAFDAMTNLRSYREPFTIEEAAEEIMRNAGTQFDPELAKIFVEKVLGIKIK